MSLIKLNTFKAVFYLSSLLIIFTARNSTYGKVMFSQACVKNYFRGACMAGGMCVVGVVCVAGGICVREAFMAGGACMTGGACVARGHVWQGGHAWQGVCMHGRGCAWCGGMCGRRDGHWSGWYTFYWNAFLLWKWLQFQSATLCQSDRQCLVKILSVW